MISYILLVNNLSTYGIYVIIYNLVKETTTVIKTKKLYSNL